MTDAFRYSATPHDPASRQWHPDQHGITRRMVTVAGVDVGEDGWAVRLVRDDLPTACIQVTTFVRDEDLEAGGGWRFWPEAEAEYMTFTDPSDPASTETTYDFDRFDDHPFDYPTQEEADSAAREMAERFTRPGYFDPAVTDDLPDVGLT